MITLVANEIYRGPEPQAPNDIAWVQRTAKTVFDLESDQETERLTPATVIYNPITFLQIYSPWHAIPAARLDWIVDFIHNAPKPLLVHCKHGEDRTGLVCAAYRVKCCGWTPKAAWAEAYKFGYRWYINFGLNETWKQWLAAR